VSVTLKKNASVIPEQKKIEQGLCCYDMTCVPSVSVSATRNREYGGRSSREFKVANVTDNMT
jgi:hypothetical protein